MKVHVIASAVLLALTFSHHAVAADAPLSPLMKQLNNGNWLAQDEAQSLSDELYYQDAIQAYIQTLPLLNTIGLRDGSEAAFGKGYNVLLSGKNAWIAGRWFQRQTEMSSIR